MAQRLDDLPLIEPRVNRELALGVLSSDSHPAVLAVAGACVVFAIGHLVRLASRSRLALVSLLLLVGGGLGNLIDRVVTGAVHDWLHLGPVVANLADFWLIGGLVGYVIAAGRSANDEVSPPHPLEPIEPLR